MCAAAGVDSDASENFLVNFFHAPSVFVTRNLPTTIIIQNGAISNSQIKLVSFGGFIHSDDITLMLTFHIKNLTFTGTTVLDDSAIIKTESFQAKSNHYFLVEEVTFADMVFASKGSVISFDHAASSLASVIQVRNSELRNNSKA